MKKEYSKPFWIIFIILFLTGTLVLSQWLQMREEAFRTQRNEEGVP